MEFQELFGVVVMGGKAVQALRFTHEMDLLEWIVTQTESGEIAHVTDDVEYCVTKLGVTNETVSVIDYK